MTKMPDGAGLDEMFPPFVRLVVGPTTDAPPCPFPEELHAAARAVAGRRREFLWGRAYARSALAALGIAPVPIAVGPGRQPLWPADVVGSIAHGGGWAGAAVAYADDAWGIGLDIEPVEPPLPPAVETLVHSAEEIASFASSPPVAHHASKVAFSAKECVFKCLFPPTGWSLDFRDATVEVDMAGRRFRVILRDQFRSPGIPAGPLEGQFRLVRGLLVAGLLVT